MIVHNNVAEPWKVTIVDTGIDTMTGGRILRIKDYVENDTFMLTYGDGVCDINMQELLKFHKSHGKIATLTAIKLGQRFGILSINEDSTITSFREKDTSDGERINGGYMVLEPEIFNYLEDDTTILEQAPLRQLASENQLMAYEYDGYWQCMDTKREMDLLNRLISEGKAPWIKW